MTYSEYAAIATQGLPAGIDYTQYLGAPNNANQYSERDALGARIHCKIIAAKLTRSVK
jgi:hypothetical protein